MTLDYLATLPQVWQVGRQKMGNTTMTREACWPVYVKEVDREGRRVLASWNGNRAQWWYENNWKKWRKEPPKPKVKA